MNQKDENQSETNGILYWISSKMESIAEQISKLED